MPNEQLPSPRNNDDSRKCGQQVSNTAGERWWRQHRTKLNSMAPGAIRNKN